jgi:hypothetical protein
VPEPGKVGQLAVYLGQCLYKPSAPRHSRQRRPTVPRDHPGGASAGHDPEGDGFWTDIGADNGMTGKIEA